MEESLEKGLKNWKEVFGQYLLHLKAVLKFVVDSCGAPLQVLHGILIIQKPGSFSVGSSVKEGALFECFAF